jgi:hypothetical protein
MVAIKKDFKGRELLPRREVNKFSKDMIAGEDAFFSFLDRAYLKCDDESARVDFDRAFAEVINELFTIGDAYQELQGSRFVDYLHIIDRVISFSQEKQLPTSVFESTLKYIVLAPLLGMEGVSADVKESYCQCFEDRVDERSRQGGTDYVISGFWNAMKSLNGISAPKDVSSRLVGKLKSSMMVTRGAPGSDLVQ